MTADRIQPSMKRRLTETPQRPRDATDSLCAALATLGTQDEVRAFLDDLCTPAELEAMADRWRVVPLLLDGLPYREIHDLTAVSVTTVGRVARCLSLGSGGYKLAAQRLYAEPHHAG